MRPSARSLSSAALALAGLLAPAARGYVLGDNHWPDNQAIVMSLQLGAPGRTFLDGFSNWDDVAEAALAVWQPYLGSGVRFVAQRSSITPQGGDRRNSVFFSSAVYGDRFGYDTLAVTVTYHGPSNLRTEADVIFNTAKAFDSYRGVLQGNPGGGPLYDLRRVAMHEFGHVLGLEHVPQTALSIMTPVITNLDTVQADDVAGVQALYGPDRYAIPTIGGELEAAGGENQPFTYQIEADHSPTAYGAVGLPPGLTLNPYSGLIFGAPTAPGVFAVTLSATNPFGTGAATLTITVAGLPEFTGRLTADAALGVPFSFPISATPPPLSFTIVSPLPAGLTLDPATGLISGTPTQVGEYSVPVEARNETGARRATFVIRVAFDLGTTVIHRFAPPPSASLLQARDGNFYGVDAAILAKAKGRVFRLTPQGALTTIYTFSGPDGARPLAALIQGNDDALYGVTDSGGPAYKELGYDTGGTIFRLTMDGKLTTLHVFDRAAERDPRRALVLGKDGNLYGTTSTGVTPDISGGTIFRLTPDGALTTLHRFASGEGGDATLMQATDGNFYGVTAYGREINGTRAGSAFRLTPDGVFTTIQEFDPGSEAQPSALVEGKDGALYGTASVNRLGPATVFRLTFDGRLTTLCSLASARFAGPVAPGLDGSFYGCYDEYTLVGGDGTASVGALYKVTPNGELTTLHRFSAAESTSPYALLQATDGEFYGVTSTYYAGAVFRTTLLIPADPDAGLFPTVTLTARTPQIVAGSGVVGAFTVSLSEPKTADVLVQYRVSGSAGNGTDYLRLSGVARIKAGRTVKQIKIVPIAEAGGVFPRKVKLTLLPDDAYLIGTSSPVKIKLVGGDP